MKNTVNEKGVTLEVLGKCMTNTTPDSQHDAKVEYRHLWSYAQQAALIAVSDKNAKTGCYELITDPERRAKRIAASYADLYFKSGEKSGGELNMHWPALAAFVVKDIVEGYRFSREEVLQREWNGVAGAARNNAMADIVSTIMTDDSPYVHVMRTYAALAKGNLWLFMDIYPWLWFFLEFGINQDGSLNQKRLDAGPPERNWNSFQQASKDAVQELPFGPNWLNRLTGRLGGDVVYKEAGAHFDRPLPLWSSDGGYSQHTASAYVAHQYCKSHVHEYDNGYRTPPSKYWKKFPQAYYVMEAEHEELARMAKDKKAVAAVIEIQLSHGQKISLLESELRKIQGWQLESLFILKNRTKIKLIYFSKIIAGISITLAFQAHAAESMCYGTTSNGYLEEGIALPLSGKNFIAYSSLGNQLGRTYLHSMAQKIVLQAYSQLQIKAPKNFYIYGETGFANGGLFKPHRTHQNGLSVDFMVPVMRDDGQSIPMPTSALNKFGYGIEFDKEAKFGELSIDFEAMAEHLYQLNNAALKNGAGIDLVIFEPEFHAKLFATKHGNYLKKNIRFMTHPAWIRHDEHYHVDFKVACKKVIKK
jgi:hypothetical protein